MGLRPLSKTLHEQEYETQQMFRRIHQVDDYIANSWPEDVEATVQFSTSTGTTYFVIFICLDKTPTETEQEMATKRIVGWLKLRYGGEVRRGFHEATGEFYWLAIKIFEDKEGKFEARLYIEQVSKDGCEIRPVRKTITVWESTCPETTEAV